MHTAIVTDSSADVPSELAKKLNIQIVPAILMMGDQSFEDGKGLTRQEFYKRLPEMDQLPTTGTPAVGSFERVYRNLFDQGIQEIISIHIASALSGIYSTARIAANNFKHRVHLIDSKSLSMGIGFQVIAAAKSAAANQSPERIIEIIEATYQNTRVMAMLDTLEYVRRSGRVGWARARIGSLLNIKPFVEIKEGQVLNFGQSRTRKKGIARLKKMLYQQGPLERIAILHSNAEQDALAFLNDLGGEIPPDPLLVNITTVIGTHAGPNALGFAVVLK